MEFPILSQSSNTLLNRNGETHFCYKFNPLDFEQIDYHDLCGYFDRLRAYFQSLNSSSYFRIYCNRGEYYLVTNLHQPEIPSISLDELNSPLFVLLDLGDFYSDVKIGDDYLNYNGKYYRYIQIKDYPSEIYENHLADLGCDFILNFGKLPSTEQTILLEYQSKNYEGKLASSKSKTETNKAQNAIGTMDDIAGKISRGEETLFRAEAWLVLKENSLDDLNLKTGELINRLLTHKLYIESINLSRVFAGCFPGQKAGFFTKGSIVVDTSFLLSLIPLTKHKLLHEGFSLYSNDGDELYYDIKHRSFDNKNSFVAGPTGTGKSLLVQHIVDYYINKKNKVIVLDKGESYLKLCKYHNGSSLTGKLNFLKFKKPQYLTDLVLEFAGRDEFNKVQKGELYSHIKEGILNNSFNTHEDFIGYLELKFPKIRFYFSDVLDFFTDQEDDSLSSEFIYCEMKNFVGKMKAPVILYLFQYFEHFKGDVIFVFEEIHNYLLTTPDSIVGTISREIRKEGGALIAVTQSVNDIDIYPLLNVLWDNSEHKFIFKHNTDPDPKYLNGYERELFLTMSDNSLKNLNDTNNEKKKFSQFLIKSNQIKKTVRLYIPKDKYELYTSDPEDKKMFNEWYFKNSNLFSDYKNAIESYARIKHHDLH